MKQNVVPNDTEKEQKDLVTLIASSSFSRYSSFFHKKISHESSSAAN